MATKADFTEDEWKTMQKGVTGAGMLVSVGDRDFTDSFGEVSALAKQLAEQREQNESQFIRELTAMRGTGFGLTASQQEVQAETIAALGSAIATLTAKAPEEVDAYRRLVLATTQAVAEAKGEVAPGETVAIATIREALG
jgi:hypothetical protein